MIDSIFHILDSIFLTVVYLITGVFSLLLLSAITIGCRPSEICRTWKDHLIWTFFMYPILLFVFGVCFLGSWISMVRVWSA